MAIFHLVLLVTIIWFSCWLYFFAFLKLTESIMILVMIVFCQMA
jgi:hypothetical protein